MGFEGFFCKRNSARHAHHTAVTSANDGVLDFSANQQAKRRIAPMPAPKKSSYAPPSGRCFCKARTDSSPKNVCEITQAQTVQETDDRKTQHEHQINATTLKKVSGYLMRLYSCVERR